MLGKPGAMARQSFLRILFMTFTIRGVCEKAYCRGCGGWPTGILSSSNLGVCGGDFETGIDFSWDSGTCQFAFTFHWIGLLCWQPEGTCFSVGVSRPISDMNCLTVHCFYFRRAPILSSGPPICLRWAQVVLV